MPRRHTTAHLFLVKVWVDEESADPARWSGSVRQVVSGEARYFHDWAGLVTILSALLPALGPAEPPAEAGADEETRERHSE